MRLQTDGEQPVGALISRPRVPDQASPHAHRWLVRHRRPGAGRPVDQPPAVPAALRGLRRRRPKDLGACARLLRVVFYEAQYPLEWPDEPRVWLDGEGVVDAWVVERQGEILGHVAISRVGREAASAVRWREVTGREPAELLGVTQFFVRPRVRGQGVGTALLDVAVAKIRSRGLVPVFEVVSARADTVRILMERGWRLLTMDPSAARADRTRIYRFAAPPRPASAGGSIEAAPSSRIHTVRS